MQHTVACSLRFKLHHTLHSWVFTLQTRILNYIRVPKFGKNKKVFYMEKLTQEAKKKLRQKPQDSKTRKYLLTGYENISVRSRKVF